MKTNKIVVYIFVIAVVALILSTSNTIEIRWNFGGFEYHNYTGFYCYLCEGHYNLETGEYHEYRLLPELLPNLVVDC